MQAAHGLLCGSHQHRSSYTEVQPMADPRASTFEQFQMVQQLWHWPTVGNKSKAAVLVAPVNASKKHVFMFSMYIQTVDLKSAHGIKSQQKHKFE